MLPPTRRRLSLLGIALSIVASMALMLMAALVSAREATSITQVANEVESEPSSSESKPTESPTIEPRKTSRVATTAERRLPICSGFRAKIVSQNRNPALSLASLSYEGNGATLVHPGSPIGEHRVVAIGYDGDRVSPNVVLKSKEGLCQAMTFEKPAQSTHTHAARNSQRRPTHAEHTEILVDRSAVEAILERSFELTRGVQLVPYIENGSIAGVRLLGIHRGSLLSALGLANGDAVLRINGQAMTTPEVALSLYSNIRSLERFDIEINRAGKPARVEIRVT